MSRLDITTETREDSPVVVVSGELDIATADDLERSIAEAQAETTASVTVDLRGLSFMDSTGLRVLLEANSRAAEAGQELVLIRGPEPVDRVFRIALLHERFHFVDHPRRN